MVYSSAFSKITQKPSTKNEIIYPKTNIINWQIVRNFKNQIRKRVNNISVTSLFDFWVCVKVFETWFCSKSVLLFHELDLTDTTVALKRRCGLVPVVLAAPGQKTVDLCYSGVSSANVMTLTDWWLQVLLLALKGGEKAGGGEHSLEGNCSPWLWRTRCVCPTCCCQTGSQWLILEWNDCTFSFHNVHEACGDHCRRRRHASGSNDSR